MEEKIFCKGGGCTAKLGAGLLSHILERIPRGEPDPNLLVGYDSRDDAAVYQVTENLAIVQTVDFFPPMVEDPYTFGQIAAANALSDIYAMGGQPRTALNLVCYPEEMDLNLLGEILRGGADKVIEAGASLVGGHSIADEGIKYGLSVMGTINPGKIYKNHQVQVGDLLILTKKLGVGIICTANRVGEASEQAMQEAIASMTGLNRTAAEISKAYDVHACTDVTGFGFLGHLHEMLEDGYAARIYAEDIPIIEEALKYADEFLLTAAGQKNRNYVGDRVEFRQVSFAMEEILYDPQTSGGLLIAVHPDQAEELTLNLQKAGLPARIVGQITERESKEILVSAHRG